MGEGSRPAPVMLHAHQHLPGPKGPVVLLILDGVGIGENDAFDAVALAHTPNLDVLRRTGLALSLIHI